MMHALTSVREVRYQAMYTLTRVPEARHLVKPEHQPEPIQIHCPHTHHAISASLNSGYVFTALRSSAE